MRKNLVTKLLLLSVLTLAAMLSFGCGEKETVPPAITPSTPGDYDDVSRPMTAEEQQAAAVITNAKIYFEFDRFDITAASKQVLNQKAEILRQYTQFRVVIEGHCDERGTEEYNLALGERRARAAYEYLVMLGVSPGQLEMTSFGKMHPAAPGHDESAWRLNRRDEFKVGLLR